jgi:hypothetical protein
MYKSLSTVAYSGSIYVQASHSSLQRTAELAAGSQAPEVQIAT